jgi:hypothetical protein
MILGSRIFILDHDRQMRVYLNIRVLLATVSLTSFSSNVSALRVTLRNEHNDSKLGGKGIHSIIQNNKRPWRAFLPVGHRILFWTFDVDRSK